MEDERTARLEEQIKFLRDDVLEIRNDIRQLLEFKWRIYGITAVIAFIVSSAAEIFLRFGVTHP